MTQKIITAEKNYAGLDDWLSENAIKSVRTEFSKALMCSKTLDVYREILEKYPVKRD